MIRKEPSLGMGGYPAQEIWQGTRLLGKITRTGTYSFWWEIENGQWDANGRCIKFRSSGHELDAERAERALISAYGTCPEEFE